MYSYLHNYHQLLPLHVFNSTSSYATFLLLEPKLVSQSFEPLHPFVSIHLIYLLILVQHHFLLFFFIHYFIQCVIHPFIYSLVYLFISILLDSGNISHVLNVKQIFLTFVFNHLFRLSFALCLSVCVCVCVCVYL